MWRSSFFQRTPAWQRSVDLELHLGHGGAPCPNYSTLSHQSGHAPSSTADEEELEEDIDLNNIFDTEAAGLNMGDMRCPPGVDSWGNRYLTVVDTSGIHFIKVNLCRCANALPTDRQLLRAGLYPASQKAPRSVFTFQVLDDCNIENLECKTSYSAYYSKIRRITSKSFPHLLPVRHFLEFQIAQLSTYRVSGVAGRQLLVAWHWSSVAGRWSPGAGHQSPVAGRRSTVASRWLSVAGRQSPGAGRWSSIASRWSSAASRWSLVVSRQSLVAGRQSLVASRADLRRHQDRYRELMRVSRQWCDMKMRKWSGSVFDHDDSNVPDGALVPFCGACPQPGVNLPDGWQNDVDG